MEQIKQLIEMRDAALARLQSNPDYKLVTSLDALISDLEGVATEMSAAPVAEPVISEPIATVSGVSSADTQVSAVPLEEPADPAPTETTPLDDVLDVVAQQFQNRDTTEELLEKELAADPLVEDLAAIGTEPEATEAESSTPYNSEDSGVTLN